MKKIIFKTLTIKNFLSIGNIPVSINFRPGLHGITGVNRDQIDRRNGVGKSTIPDALHFVLFGNTIRELKKEFIINNITGKTCEVGLTFSIVRGKEIENYEIIRSLEPSKCILYQNERDITRDSIANTTAFIEQILQCNSEIFQNCVIMTVNNTIPFMAKKKVEKRKFIEGIFNLEIFSKMLSQLREEQSTVRKDFEIESAREEEAQTTVNSLKDQQHKTHLEYESRKKLLLKRRRDNNEELENLKSKIDAFKPIITEDINKNIELLSQKLQETDSKINEFGKQMASLETKNEFIFTTVSKIGTEKDICPTCLRSISENDVVTMGTAKKQYKDEILSNESEIKAVESKIVELNILKTKIQDAIKKGVNSVQQNKLLVQQHENNNLRVEQLNQYNIQVDQDLQHLTDTSTALNTLIDQAEIKFKAANEKTTNYKKILNLMDTVKFVVSEEGIKTYIVKRILHLFNSKLAYYLKKLNSNAIITFNEYFEEQIVNDKGKLTTYFNFSGAERKVIDLAIMFTFIDMLNLQGNIFYNIQFYDELLDTSLDETGVELVLNLLNEFVSKNNFGVYVISHRKECARLVSGEMIILEKNNGITTLSSILPS